MKIWLFNMYFINNIWRQFWKAPIYNFFYEKPLNKLFSQTLLYLFQSTLKAVDLRKKFQCKCNIWLKSHEHEKSFSFRDILYQMHRQNAVHMSPIRCLSWKLFWASSLHREDDNFTYMTKMCHNFICIYKRGRQREIFSFWLNVIVTNLFIVLIRNMKHQ